VVEAAKDDLGSAVRDRREYLVAKYGADPRAAFSDIDPLDVPRAVSDVNAEVFTRLEAELRNTREREAKATAAAKMTERERQDLAKLRVRQDEKKSRQKRKERAHKSRK
jgi:hypothetical protein